MGKLITRRNKLENKIKNILQSTQHINTLLDVIDEYESDNLATIDKLKKKKQVDSKRINGALKQTINAHGPITKILIGSASKRIYGSLLSNHENTVEKISIKGFLYGVLVTTIVISVGILIF